MTVLVGSQLVAQVQLENMFKAAVMNTPEVSTGCTKFYSNL